VKPSINSEKHIRQVSLTSVATGTIENLTIAQAKDDRTLQFHVRVGSIVKAVFVELWGVGSTGGGGDTFQMSIEKVTGNSPNMSNAQSLNLETYPNKRGVLYCTQGLLPDSSDNPIPMYRDWVKIPKGKQRMGLEDRINVNVTPVTGAMEICGLFIDKEYY